MLTARRRLRVKMRSKSKFVCDKCNFETNNSWKWTQHNETKKHRSIAYLLEPENDADGQHTWQEDLDVFAEECDNMPPAKNVENDDSYTMNDAAANNSIPKGEELNSQHEWFPFNSKLDMLLYFMLNSSTHNISEEVMKYVLFVIKECGLNPPTLTSLKKNRFGDLDWSDLISQGHDETGQEFWMLKPSMTIKLAMANPKSSKSLMRYPRRTSEIRHQADGKKWANMDHFSASVGDLSFSTHGVYKTNHLGMDAIVQVLNFMQNTELDILEAKTVLVMSGSHAQFAGHNLPENCCVVCDQPIFVPVSSLRYNGNNIHRDAHIYDQQTMTRFSLQNEEKFKRNWNLQQDPVVHVPVNMFLDDTATHRSRRWLPLHCMQMQLSGLPTDVRQQQQFVTFLGASEKVDMMAQCKHVLNDLKSMGNGISAFDAHSGNKCSVLGTLDILVADNAMVSYCCNHLGASATKFCPRCKATSDTFDHIYVMRTPRETKRTVERLNIRTNETDKKRLRKLTGVKEHANCFWDVIDPHRDIPVGLLHLIPLGLGKHLIKFIISKSPSPVVDYMAVHAQDVTGLSAYESFFSHIDSRQGKDIKQYLQLAPINMLMSGVSNKFVKLMACLSKLQVMLSQPSYSEENLVELDTAINEYHSRVSRDAQPLANKMKTHMLVHITDDIRRHGPPTCYNEDAYEKKHGRVRDVIFTQNQKSRSHDLARDYAKQLLTEHVLAGGYLPVGEDWLQPSSNVQLYSKEPIVKKMMGNNSTNPKAAAGSLKKLKRQNKHLVKQPVTEEEARHISAATVVHGTAVMSQSGELVNSGDWVQFSVDEEEHFGILLGGFASNEETVVKIHTTERTSEKVIDCYKYRLTGVCFTNAKNITKKISFIHDCVGGDCKKINKNVVNMVNGAQVMCLTKSIRHTGHLLYIKNVYKI